MTAHHSFNNFFGMYIGLVDQKKVLTCKISKKLALHAVLKNDNRTRKTFMLHENLVLISLFFCFFFSWIVYFGCSYHNSC